jgi:hypothetical protein
LFVEADVKGGFLGGRGLDPVKHEVHAPMQGSFGPTTAEHKPSELAVKKDAKAAHMLSKHAQEGVAGPSNKRWPVYAAASYVSAFSPSSLYFQSDLCIINSSSLNSLPQGAYRLEIFFCC